LEKAARVEVVPEIPVACAGNAPAHGVESFILTSKTVRRARVYEHRAGIAEVEADKICADPDVSRFSGKIRGLRRRNLRALQPPLGDPLVPAAVEHGNGQ